MLLQFRVQNFMSLKDEQILSLSAGRDRKHTDTLLRKEDLRVLPTVAIFGANASGKSNLIKALQLVSSFIKLSATRMSLGDPIAGVVPFKLTRREVDSPSRFGLTLLIGETTYEYGFSATRTRVYDEWLTAHEPRKTSRRWLNRKYDSESGATEWEFGGPLQGDQKLLREKTRDNGLVLSRAAELNIESVSELFLFFRSRFNVLNLAEQPFPLTYWTAKQCEGDPAFKDRVLDLLKQADLGILGFDVEYQKWDESKPLILPPGSAARVAQDDDGRPFYDRMRVATLHRGYDSKEHPVEFDLESEESHGTQRFFALLGPVLDTLDNGSVLAVDEIECSMHPLLTRKIIEMFRSPSVNKNGAQLLFSTQNTFLLDPQLLRRDEVYFVEKGRNGVSKLFSLYDFDEPKPRSSESFEKNYLAGRYGAVPRFGEFFEDLELE